MDITSRTSELYHYSLSQIEDLVIWLNADYEVLYTNHNANQQVGRSIEVIAELSGENTWQQFLSNTLKSHSKEGSIEGYLCSNHKFTQVRTNTLDDKKAYHLATQFNVKVLSKSHDEVQFIIVCKSQETVPLQPVYNSKLEELNKAFIELESTNTDLAKSAQAKDEFLASMSHELRTPLNSILGLCEALLEGVYGQLDHDQHQPVRQVFSNGHHLLSVISDILDLSKLRAGGITLSLNEIDVEACCFEALQIFRGEMQKKSLSVNVSIDGVYSLQADERWFKQVLMNLLSNAVKFTNTNQKVGLIVGESPKIGYLRVSVWDEGIGIKQEDIPRLFQNFVQLDTSLARAYEGTGLGLSIVSQVMKLHGGEVSVQSTLGQGSQFHLDFPWVPEQIKESSHPITQAQLTDLKSVLLIEDSTIDGDRIKRYLDEANTEVIWDKRGNRALSLAEQHLPDIIILDLFLPESSGWDILTQLKSNQRLSKIPVLVCSVLPQDERRTENNLIQGYLQKPFSRRALESSINSISVFINAEACVSDDYTQQIKESSILAKVSPNPRKALMISANEYHQTKDDYGGDLQVTNDDKADQNQSDNAKRLNDILIVDDNLSNIQLISDYLSRKGYQIVTAEDGYQAVQAARVHRPKLILMDIQMPHMDGIEATKHIKTDPNISTIPIFALTALAMPGDRERCLNAGMDDYFTKPVSLRALYKKIKDTIG